MGRQRTSAHSRDSIAPLNFRISRNGPRSTRTVFGVTASWGPAFGSTASWEIPAGVILSAFILAGAANLLDLTPFTALYHLVSGSLLFGAFFIATDPVTSPLTPKGKFSFGLGIGALIVLLRVFSGYPEGVMFAVLLMNAVVPLLNRWTIPRPVGGPAPQRT